MKDNVHRIVAIVSALGVVLPQAFDIGAPPVEAAITLVGWLCALFTDRTKLALKK